MGASGPGSVCGGRSTLACVVSRGTSTLRGRTGSRPSNRATALVFHFADLNVRGQRLVARARVGVHPRRLVLDFVSHDRVRDDHVVS